MTIESSEFQASMPSCGINKFFERDIDLFLAEELRVNARFGLWIMNHFRAGDALLFPADSTNVSVVEDGSEADVVALFRKKGGNAYKLFVENKISATLMPEQLERYVRRGANEVQRGLISGFSVLFFTPSNYFSTSLPPGVVHISFEAAATELRSISTDLRSDYRASLLKKALPIRTRSARDADVEFTDPYIKSWWDSVDTMLEREFAGFFDRKTRYSRSVYFAPESPGQAKYLRVDFKGHKGEVDLAFKNISSEALESLLSRMGKAPPGRVVANGKSSAIQIAELETFVIADGFKVVDNKVRAAYQAAYDFLMFWKNNRIVFDELGSSILDEQFFLEHQENQ